MLKGLREGSYPAFSETGLTISTVWISEIGKKIRTRQPRRPKSTSFPVYPSENADFEGGWNLPLPRNVSYFLLFQLVPVFHDDKPRTPQKKGKQSRILNSNL